MVTGDRYPESWNVDAGASDFFYLKGTIEVILERLGIQNLRSKPANTDIYSEGLAYSAGKTPVVSFGLVHPKILKAMDIKQPVLFADFIWDNVLMLLNKKGIQFREIPKFPEVRRDLALLLDNSTTFNELYQAAMQSEKKLLKSVNLFDVYEGKNLPEGKKSYALSFTLGDDQKTLNDKQIDKVMQKLQKTFEKQFAATLR